MPLDYIEKLRPEENTVIMKDEEPIEIASEREFSSVVASWQAWKREREGE